MAVRDIDERELALEGARIMRDAFAQAQRSGAVLYVENDKLLRRLSDGRVEFVKKIEGRDPDLNRTFLKDGKFKLKRKASEALI